MRISRINVPQETELNCNHCLQKVSISGLGHKTNDMTCIFHARCFKNYITTFENNQTIVCRCLSKVTHVNNTPIETFWQNLFPPVQAVIILGIILVPRN